MMIRASKQISLNANQIYFNNSFALAPIMNLNGLILRADRPLTEQLPIKDFLSKQGAQVSRVKISYKNHSASTNPDKYEYYIRIHGTFVVSQQDTKEFLDNNAIFIANQLDGIEQISTATSMQSCIAAQYNFCKEKATYADLSHNLSWEVAPSGTCAEQELNMSVGTQMVTSAPILGGNLINITTNQLVSKGRIFLGNNEKEQLINAGLMTPVISLKNTNIKFSSYAHLQDTFIQGETVDLTYNGISSKINDDKEAKEHTDGTLTLGIDPKIDWLNNPYHGFSPMFSIKSKVNGYEVRKKRDVDGEERLVIIKAIPRPL